MSNKDFDILFEEKVKENIKLSFDDINISTDFKNRIKDEVAKKRTLGEKILDILNYEVEVPVGRLAIVAALLAIIPTSFTIYEGKKIMDNNIKDAKEYVMKDNGRFNKIDN